MKSIIQKNEISVSATFLLLDHDMVQISSYTKSQFLLRTLRMLRARVPQEVASEICMQYRFTLERLISQDIERIVTNVRHREHQRKRYRI